MIYKQKLGISRKPFVFLIERDSSLMVPLPFLLLWMWISCPGLWPSCHHIGKKSDYRDTLSDNNESLNQFQEPSTSRFLVIKKENKPLFIKVTVSQVFYYFSLYIFLIEISNPMFLFFPQVCRLCAKKYSYVPTN